MEALYTKAREHAREHAAAATSVEQDPQGSENQSLHGALSRLLARILQPFEECVTTASAQGLFETVLFTFDATDMFEGYFVLYLVKGPREPPPRPRSRVPFVPPPVAASPEFAPLLLQLQQRLQPFKVRHEWQQGTALNKVVVSWG